MGATEAEILRKARALVTEEKGWTRGVYARTAGGGAVAWEHPDAACFCAEGAIYRAARESDGDALKAREVFERAAGTDHVPGFNDGRNGDRLRTDRHPRRAPVRHRKVLTAFDGAIELAESE